MWVEGEISNFRPAPSGHVYFTLKDADAQLPVVLFRRQAMLLRFRPEDGLHVLVRGRVSVYEQRGQMQLVAETMEPVGRRLTATCIRAAKRKTEGGGPLRRGAQAPAAAISPNRGDRHVAHGRGDPGLSQHRGAAPFGIECAALPGLGAGRFFSRRSRGRAGVPEWLGTRRRHRNRARRRIPRGPCSLQQRTRSASHRGVPPAGGFSDRTRDRLHDCRFCGGPACAHAIGRGGADHRSAAQRCRASRPARIIAWSVRRGSRYCRLGNASRAFQPAAQSRAWPPCCAAWNSDLMTSHFAWRTLSISSSARASARSRNYRRPYLRHDPRQQLAHARGHFDACRSRLDRTLERTIEAQRARLGALDAQLNSLSPLAVLDRGYALVLDAHGSLVRSTSQVAPGETVRTRLSDGTFTSRVESATKQER